MAEEEKLQLLVVEDDEDDYFLIRRLLQSGLKNAEVERASTVDDALQRTAQNPYDLFLLDYRLGEKSGLELLRELKHRDAAADPGEPDLSLAAEPPAPVIFLTGQGDERVAVEAMKAGATDYLPKSRLSAPALNTAVRYAINLRHKDEAVRAARRALHASERRFRALVENSTDVVVLLDPQATILYISQSVRRILGFSPEEMVESCGFDYVHPDDLPAVKELFNVALQSPGLPLRGEYRLRAKNAGVPGKLAEDSREASGSRLEAPGLSLSKAGLPLEPAACSLQPCRGEGGVPSEPEGGLAAVPWRVLEATMMNRLRDPAVGAVVVNGRDITDRRSAELALRLSEHEYRTLFENANDGIIIFEPASEVILEANPQACLMYGFPHEQLVGMSLQRISHDVERGRQAISRVLTTGSLKDFETVHYRKDGAPLCILANASLIQYRGQKAVLSLSRDISERKLAEKEIFRLHRALQALSKCTQAVLHAHAEQPLVQEICEIAVQVGGYRMAWVGVPGVQGSRLGASSCRGKPALPEARSPEPGALLACSLEPASPADDEPAAMPLARAGHDQGFLDALRALPEQLRRELPVSVVLRTGEAFACRDIAAEPRLRHLAPMCAAHGFGSMLGLPLLVDAKTFGALMLYASEKDAFDAAEVGLLRELAANLAYGIGSLRARAQRATAEAESRKLHSAVEQSADVVVITDREGVIEYVNPAFERLTGYSRDEAVGRTPRILKSGKHEPSFYTQLWATIVHGEVFRDVVINRKKNGELYYSEKTITPVLDEGGAIRHFISNDRDITERILGERERLLAEEELRASEHQYRMLVETASEGIWTIDAEDRTTFVNAKMAAMLGYEPREMLARPLYDFVLAPAKAPGTPLTSGDRPAPPSESPTSDVRPPMARQPDQGFSLPWLQRLRMGMPQQLDTVLRRKDGGQVYVMLNCNPIYSRSGEYAGALAMSTDISERKMLEEQLRQSQKLDAVGQLAGGVAHDFNNLLMVISSYAELLSDSLQHDPKALRETGQILKAARRAAALTRQLLAFSRKQVLAPRVLDLNTVLADFGRLLPRLIGEDIEVVLKPGQDLWKVKVDPVQIEQVLMNLAVNARDAMTGSPARPELACWGVAMTGSPASLPPHATNSGRDTGLLAEGSSLQESACSGMPPFDRLRAGAGTLEPGGWQSGLPGCQGARLTLETANVTLDEEYARRHAGVSPGDYVMTAVTDTGAGIPADILPHIFEPFFTTKAQGKGTGLGLPTVYGIVKQSGGFVWVYSELGQGTSFKVYLPRAEQADSLPAPHAPEPAPRGSEAILLVEDEEAVREPAGEFLTLRGYTVLQAKNGSDALLVLEHYVGTVELLVTDVIMPGMSGRELAARIADVRPGMRVLYISGYTQDTVERHGIGPASHFLQKPFSLSALGRKVREVLDDSDEASGSRL